MNSRSLVATLAFSLLLPAVAHGQTASVVTDPGLTSATTVGFAEQVAKQVEQIEKIRQQVEQAKAQLEQAKAQYDSLTGSRNLGEVLNDSKYRDYLPEDWQRVYDSVRTGGYSGLTGNARTIQTQNQVFDSCASVSKNKDALAACQARAAMPAQQKAFAQGAFDKARERLEQIDALMRQINQTSDPKAIAELQARIALEQAAIQNEQTKLQMFQLVSQAERDLQRQREQEIEAKRWSTRKGIPPPGH